MARRRRRKQSFLAFIGMLNDVEKDVVRIFIKHNIALAIRTVRNFLVIESASENMKKLEPYITFDVNLYKALTSDAEVIAKGFSPLSVSEQVEILEKALRDKLGISIYTWGSINRAIKQLLAYNLIDKRRGEIPGQKKGTLYFVSPQLYLLWQKEYDKLRDKSHKSDVEKFWFECKAGMRRRGRGSYEQQRNPLQVLQYLHTHRRIHHTLREA